MNIKTIDIDNPNPEPLRPMSHGGDIEWAVTGDAGYGIISALPRKIKARNHAYKPSEGFQRPDPSAALAVAARLGHALPRGILAQSGGNL
jgi:hypothetical protein